MMVRIDCGMGCWDDPERLVQRSYDEDTGGLESSKTEVSVLIYDRSMHVIVLN